MNLKIPENSLLGKDVIVHCLWLQTIINYINKELREWQYFRLYFYKKI